MTITFISTDRGKVGTVSLSPEGTIVYEGIPERLINEWNKHGVEEPGDGPFYERLVKPEEGLRFLKALPYQYNRGTYLRAVEED